MAPEADTQKVEEVKQTTIGYAMQWGRNPLPPALLATLTTALHFRPFQPLPMLFPPVLLLSTYLNLNGFRTDSAGITAAWSGLYVIMAGRRKAASFGKKFGARGLVRGAAVGLAAVNTVGCGVAYAFGKGGKEDSIL